MFQTYSLSYKDVGLECLDELDTGFASSGDIFQQPLSNKTRRHMPSVEGFRDFKLTLVVRGTTFEEYQTNVTRTLRLLNEGTLGVLCHPFQGDVVVACVRNSISLKESFSSLGLSTIDVEFYEVTPDSKTSNILPRLRISPLRLKLSFVDEMKNKLTSFIQNNAQLQGVLSKMATVRKYLKQGTDFLNTVRDNVNQVTGYVNQAFGKFEGILAQPTLFRTSLNSFNSIKGRFTSILNRFKNPERIDLSNPVISVGLITATAELIDKIASAPDEETTDRNPINNVLNAEGTTDSIKINLLKESQNVYTDIIKSDEAIRQQQLLSFGNNTNVDTLENPKDLADSIIIRSIRVYEEFLHLYNFLTLLEELENFEFETTDAALDAVRILKENTELMGDYKEVSSTTITNARKAAMGVRELISQQLPDLQQLREVETKNLPLRVVLYRYTGSTNALYSTYALNPLFDIRQTPDTISIIQEPNA